VLNIGGNSKSRIPDRLDLTVRERPDQVWETIHAETYGCVQHVGAFNTPLELIDFKHVNNTKIFDTFTRLLEEPLKEQTRDRKNNNNLD
jgi:hypothetical protein